jgi:chromosome segregation ATPase
MASRDSLARQVATLAKQVEKDLRIHAIQSRIKELEGQREELLNDESRLTNDHAIAAESSARAQQDCHLLHEQKATYERIAPACSAFGSDSTRAASLADQLNVLRERIGAIATELSRLHAAL